MIEGKPHLPWPEADDKIVVAEMLQDLQSRQWYECREFVRKRIQIQAKNISQDHWDDIVQDTMIRINRSLPTFQYQCKLKTWIVGIIRNSIIDTYRKLIRAGHFIAPLGENPDDVEHECDTVINNMTRTVEDECILRNELEEAVSVLQEYLSAHINPKRNERILQMVLFESRSLEEVAQLVGCSAPVAGYIVRSAQRYVRERLGNKP